MSWPSAESSHFVHEWSGLSTHIKVQVVRPQRLQCLFKTGTDFRLVRVPNLGSDEDIFTLHTAVLDALADFVLILVYQSAIDVAVSSLEGDCDGSADLTRGGLPCS